MFLTVSSQMFLKNLTLLFNVFLQRKLLHLRQDHYTNPWLNCLLLLWKRNSRQNFHNQSQYVPVALHTHLIFKSIYVEVTVESCDGTTLYHLNYFSSQAVKALAVGLDKAIRTPNV